MKRKNSIMGMAFFGPALVLLTLFLFLPMLLTFGFSFTDYFALNPELTHFVGLENYINIFKDELFVQSFLNTVKFVIIIVPLQCGGALLLALAINKCAHCKKYFKVAFFVPVVMSLAVVSTLWMQIYSPEGILNTLLANVGIDTQPFIHSADQALPSIAIMSVWQGVGYQMIIFLGGLQNINPALYEAAEMDHASGWQKFKDITLPELKPLCIFVFITVTIGAFRMLVQPMVMTGGGPGPLHLHDRVRHLRDRHGQLGDGTCVHHGDRIHHLRRDPDDHTEHIDKRQGGKETCSQKSKTN